MNTTRRLFKALLAEARIHDPTLKVRLRVGRSEEFPAPRDHAYCASFGGKIEIVVAPKMSRASLERQAGVLAHELGHAILFHKRANKHRERDADEVARQVVGRSVRYDQEDVQTLGCGKRVRPGYLPR